MTVRPINAADGDAALYRYARKASSPARLCLATAPSWDDVAIA